MHPLMHAACLPHVQAIRTACAFSYWAVAYARNEAAFVKDFQRAFQRMLQVEQ